MVEDASSEPLYPTDEPHFEHGELDAVKQDVMKMLSLMRNPRHRLVIQRHLLDGYEYRELVEELETSVADLYNIKKRALTDFTAIALK